MRSILTLLCIISITNAFAKDLRDSIGVENNNGRQVIVHKVTPKENYYSIGRIYGVSPKDIIEFNKIKTLQPGTTIRVPTNRPFVIVPSETKTKVDGDLIEYKVGPRETLYAIARRFNTNVEEIKRINSLKSNNLTVGQIIKVRQGTTIAPAVPGTAPIEKTEPVAPVVPTPEETDSASQDAVKVHPNRYGLTERSEHGAAVWIEDENLDSSRMFALHKTAPIGTVIKITNPMNGKSTFAKVVGKYTENETTKDVIIVVTKATADLLGALDKRFQVNIDYGVPNE